MWPAQNIPINFNKVMIEYDTFYLSHKLIIHLNNIEMLQKVTFYLLLNIALNHFFTTILLLL